MPELPDEATDAATTQALANALRTALINQGLAKAIALLVLFLCIVGLLMAMTLPANAYVDTQTLGTTNNVAASTTVTTNTGNPVDVSNHDHVTIYLYFKPLGADVGGTVTLQLARSSTGATYETSPLLTVTAPATTTNQVVYVTNFTGSVFGAATWVKVISIANGATNGITNLVVEVNRQHIY